MCVIFLKKNYNFTNKYICDKLLNRYRERNNKEYICKKCHNNLKHSVLIKETKEELNTANTLKHDNRVYPAVHEQQDETVTQEIQSNQLQSNMTTMCICCEKRIILGENTSQFIQHKYNFNSTVEEIFQNRAVDIKTVPHICNSCDISLINGQFPVNILHNGLTCFFCEEMPEKIFHVYDRNVYQNNAFGDQLKYNDVIIEKGSIICDKCHKLLLNKCEVKCMVCGRMKQRKNTYVCDQRKYRSSLKKIDKFHEILKDKETKHYICKSCHTDIQSQFQCVCCKLHFDTHLCKEFNSNNYDLTNFIVSRCLQSANDEDQNYICVSCDKTLQKTSNENPVVPFHVHNKSITSAAKFMKSLQEKPEYVCTCCHRLMFRNTVKLFNIEKYNITNDIVKKCLSYRYRMKILKADASKRNSQYIQHDCPEINGNIINNDSDYEYMEEFICIWCSTSLQQSKPKSLQQNNPKMPDQACANDLNLDPIPQDLTELSTMERRLISYRLPFLTLIAMRRYGGHYKINGPPVNVPAKLDKIVEMLPRMPNELQLIPLKLKCKLEYKSYYMFDVV